MRVVTEPAIGAVDGTNCLFSTSVVYRRQTLVVFLNGIVLRKDWENGWKEFPLKRFRVLEAPLVGDDLQVQYIPAGRS